MREGSGRFIHKTPTVSTPMPHSAIFPDVGAPSGPVLSPLAERRGARGGSHSSGPSETTGSRIPLVSAVGTTNRQRVEKLSRPSSTSFLIRLSLAKRRPNKGIREAADDVGISGASLAPFPLPLSLSPRSLSALSAPHLQPSPSLLPLKTHLSSTVFTVTYAQLVRFLSVSLFLSPSPSFPYRREYRCCPLWLANCTAEFPASASIMRLGSHVIPLCFMR